MKIIQMHPEHAFDLPMIWYTMIDVHLGPILPTWINFNPSMDSYSHA